MGFAHRNLSTRFYLTRAVQHARRQLKRCITSLASPRKDQLLAASRTASKNPVISSTGRISFAKIAEPMEVPDLLDLQVDGVIMMSGSGGDILG